MAFDRDSTLNMVKYRLVTRNPAPVLHINFGSNPCYLEMLLLRFELAERKKIIINVRKTTEKVYLGHRSPRADNPLSQSALGNTSAH